MFRVFETSKPRRESTLRNVHANFQSSGEMNFTIRMSYLDGKFRNNTLHVIWTKRVGVDATFNQIFSFSTAAIFRENVNLYKILLIYVLSILMRIIVLSLFLSLSLSSFREDTTYERHSERETAKRV